MKPRDVRIETVLNGWVVRVGCQTLVFKELTSLLKDLEAYLTNPEAAETAYQENAVNAEFFDFVNAEVAVGGRIEQRLEEAHDRVVMQNP